MSEDIIKSTAPDSIVEVVMDEKPNFKGYTLTQLRYQKAMVDVKKDFMYSNILNDINEIKNRKFFFSDKTRPESESWFSRIFSNMNYLDYAMMGISAFSTMKKMFSFFRRKK